MISTIIDVKVLSELVAAALLAGIGVTAVFGLMIYGSTRSADMRREGKSVGAVFFAAVAGLATLVFAGSVVFGLFIMTDK